MARSSMEKADKKAILDARKLVAEAAKLDCNEAETRRRIERIFVSIMGYDAFKHLSRERAVRGAGETEHVDFAIQMAPGDDAKPEIMVEIKRVNINLAPKHMKQVASYAINAGCEWMLLTNSKSWQLHHVSFGQPPVTKLVHSWDLLEDEVPKLAHMFSIISYKNVKKGALADLWQKTNILHPRNLLQAILSEGSLRYLRRELRRDTDVALTPEDVAAGVRRLLNETALSELENVHIALASKPTRKRKPRAKKADTSKAEAPKETEAPQANVVDFKVG